MKVTFYGIGYVGLVQATVLADAGHDVCCVDIDETRINNLKKGIIPIYEPGLTPLVEKNFADGRLIFTTDAKFGVEFGDLQFIAVGTPPDEDGSADLKYVLKVAETVATHMTTPKVIIDKSTVPVGTADKVKAKIQSVLHERKSDLEFAVVSNPEFLKEGAAVNDCKRPDRIIIGTDSKTAEEQMRELYAPFNRNHEKIIVMDIKSAELTKYAANCMLATKISFMNEMANIAERVGADIENVRQGIGSDSRIGFQFIYPGCGYGGSCFPKDVQALVRTADGIGYESQILKAVEAVNYAQKNKMFEYISKHFDLANNPAAIKGKNFAVWGLSFKPNTDDMREAPSRVLMEQLWAAGANVQAYDPEAMEETQRIYGSRADLSLMGTKESALNNADALVICTEWQNFRAPDFDLIKSQLNESVVFDGRNLFEPERMDKKSIKYYSIGRGLSILGE
ncbi:MULTISPECIES: UDP-glucose dehydrogenase family protein [unclassified Pseudoalteromonas]|uniref:UDP-glucose dehydrogenase family protein n=1 Tax=unclassified Pseudoalteromonas TaxID=194690 RepID=UPI0013FD3B13|nr:MULTISPECIES: UDP-glucose/GDP-mannose dehydrogenase family protein [unclassified Pseudoalteromonas]MBH0052317.1 UDP-glucose/GDP-mannose dehydrogenase family protein [Pseudoalteromonas sp. SWYJZ19]